jgi:hypothetical protein
MLEELKELKSIFPNFYQCLIENRELHPELDVYEVLPGATEEDIQQIEADVHIELPASYKRFLRCTRGMALLGGAVQLGAEHPWFHDWSDRFKSAELLSSRAPSHGMLCFADCWLEADGDQVLFEVSAGLQDEEYPVMYYAHDSYYKVRKLADSFEEWIERWLPSTFGSGDNPAARLLRPADTSETLLRPAHSTAPDAGDLLLRPGTPEQPLPISLIEDVRQFVAEQLGEPIDKIRPTCRLEEDLGVTGDQATQLLEAFARHFQVNLEGLEFAKHFGPEGWFNPRLLFFLPRGLWGKDYGHYPITVAHLAQVVAGKHWIQPGRV